MNLFNIFSKKYPGRYSLLTLILFPIAWYFYTDRSPAKQDYENKKNMSFQGTLVKISFERFHSYTIEPDSGYQFDLYNMSSEFGKEVKEGDRIVKNARENVCKIIRADTSIVLPFGWVPY